MDNNSGVTMAIMIDLLLKKSECCTLSSSNLLFNDSM